MELNLTANTPSEQKILEYLQNNASETLADKINNGTPFEKDGNPLLNKKTLAGFMKYACEEARKTVESGSSSACIEDSVVFGWTVHYFEEESIEGTLYTLDGEEYKPAVKAKNAQNDADETKKKLVAEYNNAVFDSDEAMEESERITSDIAESQSRLNRLGIERAALAARLEASAGNADDGRIEASRRRVEELAKQAEQAREELEKAVADL